MVGNSVGDALGAIAGRAAEDRSGLLVPASEPRDDGSHERDGAMDAGALRGLDADAERRGCAGRDIRSRRTADPEVRGLQDCCSAAASAGAEGTDWVRQAVLIAKQMPGTPVKLLWSREEDMTHGRYHPVTQCKLTAGLDANGNVTALHMRISGQSILAGRRAGQHQGRQGSGRLPGTQRAGAGSVDHLWDSEPAGRSRDAQSACSARILARRQPQPEHDLSRVLHRRGRARDGAGSARAAAQADRQSEGTRGA